jgi:hypothetical protein
VHSLTLFQDIDGKELQFLGENRPAKRYLYFRFIITYLNAKRSGFKLFTDQVEAKKNFFASPGSYLRKSTLLSLARNILGCELPPSIFQDTTFETEDETSITDLEEREVSLAAQVRAAAITSIKHLEPTKELECLDLEEDSENEVE